MAKHFEAAAIVGLLAHLLGKEANDPELHGGLSLALTSLEEIKERDEGSPETIEACSFCGGKRPDVRLVGGAKAFICRTCAETALDGLRRE